jgi:glutamate dehydrogenase
MTRLCFHHGFDVSRARLDVVSDDENGSATILRMLVTPVENIPEAVTDEIFNVLAQELRRVKWLDPGTMELAFVKHPHVGVQKSEVITCLCSLIHPILAKQNAIGFSLASIMDKVTHERFMSHAVAIADLFLARFNPATTPLAESEFEDRCSEIRALIESNVEDSIATEILLKMIEVVGHTLKTNVFMPDRYALGLRLDPKIMISPEDDPRTLPFGIIFTHGRRFNAYHVRFRDISRGGMRLVTPSSSELFALESIRQFDECYGLAFAQQLKNKDIPGKQRGWQR